MIETLWRIAFEGEVLNPFVHVDPISRSADSELISPHEELICVGQKHSVFLFCFGFSIPGNMMAKAVPFAEHLHLPGCKMRERRVLPSDLLLEK